jgi:hypothetical protein
MTESTSLMKNWAVDHRPTENKEETLKDKVISNTLKDVIKKRVKYLSNTNTKFEPTTELNSLDSEGNQDDLFELPKFPLDFLAIDSKKYFYNTQKWVGHILEIKGETIVAKLSDINNPTTHEIADFELIEVSPEDRELISIGASFYWSLGYSNYYGQVEKKSLIRFQRTKPWDETDLTNITDRANELYNSLKWD